LSSGEHAIPLVTEIKKRMGLPPEPLNPAEFKDRE